jgi:hypothetical protein
LLSHPERELRKSDRGVNAFTSSKLGFPDCFSPSGGVG